MRVSGQFEAVGTGLGHAGDAEAVHRAEGGRQGLGEDVVVVHEQYRNRHARS
jgi:hypothetical protein